jgi:hypothetical protein
MFDNIQSNTISDVSQNDPSVAFGANAIMGNTQFQLQAPQSKGTIVQPGMPQIPYVGIEWIFYFTNSSNPNQNPALITSGSNTGEQVTSGQITQSDASGISRVSQGTILG